MMTSLQSPLYASAITVCLFSAGLLRDNEHRSGRRFTFFLAFLAAEILALAFELLTTLPSAPLKGLWLALWMGSSLLVAPSLWLAVREGAEREPPALARIDRRHGFAILVGFALTLPLFATANWGTTFAQTGVVVSRQHSLAIHAGMLGCIAIFVAQVPFYLWRSRQVLVAATGAPNWLALPLVVVGTTWAIGIARTLQCVMHGPQDFLPWLAVIEVGVTVGALYLVVRRVSRLEVPPAVTAASFLATKPELPASKYAKSHLDNRVRERIKAKLSAAMSGEALYRDSLLNLRSLSRAVKENPHYVSQVINQDLGTTFYALVNRHRIDEAARRLDSEPQRTILEIGLAVGFNSKSTFNAAFRAQLGTTPRSYRERTADDSNPT